MARTRLSPAQRRDHLMDVGVAAFADRPYADVSMDDIAQDAGVSRALVYHYFPTKRDFFAAIWERAHDDLLVTATLNPDDALGNQIRRSLVAHLSFYERHAPLVFIANRSAISSDPVVRGPVDADLDRIRQRVLDAAGVTGRDRARASAALAGWLAFVRDCAIEWLQRREITQDEVADLCMDALRGCLGPIVDLDRPPRGR